jgi:membrane protein DedA with SNARE-associated domain
MFESLANAVGDSGWAYAIVLGLAFLDSFFPVVPSETAVITGGVLAAGGHLRLELVVLTAAVGAFLGDNFTYGLGRGAGERGRRLFFRGERGRRVLAWAERTLAERGGELVVVARFIPGGRTATTFTCGLTRFPWRRFLVYTAIGGLIWGLYGGLLGYLGGNAFKEQPWKGLLLAFAIAGSVTLVSEVVRHFRRRGTRTDP